MMVFWCRTDKIAEQLTLTFSLDNDTAGNPSYCAGKHFGARVALRAYPFRRRDIIFLAALCSK